MILRASYTGTYLLDDGRSLQSHHTNHDADIVDTTDEGCCKSSLTSPFARAPDVGTEYSTDVAIHITNVA